MFNFLRNGIKNNINTTFQGVVKNTEEKIEEGKKGINNSIFLVTALLLLLIIFTLLNTLLLIKS